ncbi:10383_t:CDS:2, partial [Gigaspora rosea]
NDIRALEKSNQETLVENDNTNKEKKNHTKRLLEGDKPEESIQKKLTKVQKAPKIDDNC